MNQSSSLDTVPLDDQFEQWVDRVCDRFEAELKKACSPRIEDHLAGLTGKSHDRLLRELLLVELEFAARSPDGVDPAVYRERFPEHLAVVHAALVEAGVLTPDHASQTQQVYTLSATLVKESTALPDRPLARELRPGAPADAEPPILVLGDYEIHEQLGDGGMGIVYRARHRTTGRIVALKIIRRDQLARVSDDQQANMIARFHTEAQAAASLDHDHIVTMYEVGEVDGFHYLSMQYVPGESLGDKIVQGPLSHQEAACYLEPVARAVHEAHKLGVVHRDIKPRNILIDQRNNRPLVADFGLAKLQRASDTLTAAGSIFGSPPYMSPEQVFDSGQVTAATDIYGLGATLYHLITGRPPFQAATPAETVYQVLNQAPPPPRLLNPPIEQDLETICLKCLEKEPNKRYRTAEALADDLRRYLHREPIVARPIGIAERFWRLCLRNQLLSSVIGVAAMLLIVATLFALDGYFRASQSRDREAQARQRAEEQRVVALESFDLAREAVEANVTRVSDDPLMRARGLEKLRRDQLQIAREFYEKLVALSPNDPELLHAQGQAHHQLAKIHATLGELEDAQQAIESALMVRKRLQEAFPKRLSYVLDLAQSYDALGSLNYERGTFDEAKSKFEEAMRLRARLADHPSWRDLALRGLSGSRMRLGEVYEKTGLLDQAVRSYQLALDMLTRLPEDDRQQAQTREALAVAHSHLARAHFTQGDLAAAEKEYQESLEISTQLADAQSNVPRFQELLAMAHNNLADLFQRTGRLQAAEQSLLAAQRVILRLAQVHPDVTSYRLSVATCFNNLASLYQEAGDFSAAEKALRESLDLNRELMEADPGVIDYQHDFALSQLNLAILLLRTDQQEEAEQILIKTREMLEQLTSEYPNVGRFQHTLAATLNNLANLAVGQERLQEAESTYLLALEICQDLVDNQRDPQYRSRLASIQLDLGLLYASGGKAVEAERSIEHAVELFDALANNHPTVPEYLLDCAVARFNLSLLLSYEFRYDEAKQLAVRADQDLEKLLEHQPDHPDYLAQQAAVYDHLANLHPDRVEAAPLEAAVEIWGKLHQQTENGRYLLQQAKGCGTLGDLALSGDQAGEAIDWYSQAISLHEQLPGTELEDRYLQHLLLVSYSRRGNAYQRAGDYAAASKDWEQALRYASERQEQLDVRLQLAAAQARAGQHQRSAENVQQVMREAAADAGRACESARVLSLASHAARNDSELSEEQAAKLAEELLEAAARLLDSANQQGYFEDDQHRAWLLGNPDLTPLRAHPKVQRLIAGLASQSDGAE